MNLTSIHLTIPAPHGRLKVFIINGKTSIKITSSPSKPRTDIGGTWLVAIERLSRLRNLRLIFYSRSWNWV